MKTRSRKRIAENRFSPPQTKKRQLDLDQGPEDGWEELPHNLGRVRTSKTRTSSNMAQGLDAVKKEDEETRGIKDNGDAHEPKLESNIDAPLLGQASPILAQRTLRPRRSVGQKSYIESDDEYLSPKKPARSPTKRPPGKKRTVKKEMEDAQSIFASEKTPRKPSKKTKGTPKLFLVLLLCLAFAGRASAFGAGEVAGTSDFNGYVWRHGDIVEVLRYLPASFITHYRFSSLERRQIYFGNWLRDFSQVIDTTCLENVPEPALRAIVSVLGFLEFGFATDEFEVTRDRLGCYTHVEHIDNPKGYAENAKQIDRRLRGPVDPRELEFDPKTGMKNYIANSGNGWDTSADYIRRQLRQCIELGRREKDPQAKKEAFILLGAALHTLEDFSAHSNFTELCLWELGEEQIFSFVGDACRVKTPGWKGRMVPPIVTGTFGMLDIFHSLLGEADDMAVLQCKGSLENLEGELNIGAMAFNQLYELVKAAIESLTALASKKEINDPLLKELETVGVLFHKAEESVAASNDKGQVADKTIDANMLWQSIEPIFFLHDRIKKWIQESCEQQDAKPMTSEPSTLLGKYTDELVFKYLSLMMEASIMELRNAVRAAKERVDVEAAKSTAAEVYQDGNGSDPSHSDLSKDHFNNILNQPAGLVATVTTNWTTQQVVRCWDDEFRDAEKTIEEILSILHHPAYPGRKKTEIQTYMFEAVQGWWDHNSEEEKAKIRSKLNKESVKARSHEDHTLTLKDLEGKKKGAAEFPGSRPRVRQPPRKPSPLSWAIVEAKKDAKWALGAVRRSVTDPRAAVQFVGSAIYVIVAYIIWLVTSTIGLLTGWVLRS